MGTGRNAFLAATVPAPGVAYISRTVQVTTTKAPLFGKALVVKNTINFNGNNVTVDSYDSTISDYDIHSNRGDKGDVTTDSDIVGNVSTGNGDIWGHVSTGPHATLKIGPNGVIGSLAWHAGNNKGIQPGWLKKDANMLMPDVQAPWTQGSFHPPGPQGIYKYALDGGNFEVAGNLNLASSDQLFVLADSILWVRGNVNFDAGSYVKINSQTRRLTMYVSGDIIFSGNWDKKIDPSQLLVYGLPSCKSINVTTGSELDAVIYAPQAALTLLGNADFYGAAVADSVSMNGRTGFHYDESLAKNPATRCYLITSWKEI